MKRRPAGLEAQIRDLAKERRDLAYCALMLAHLGGMPNTFWHSDSRIAYACETLGWTTYEAQEWAEKQVEENDPVGWLPPKGASA